VHVWINDWTPVGKVTISLTTTGSQHATFSTSRCHQRSSCTIPAPGKTPAELHARVTAKHAANSITVKAVGQASAGTLSQPLAVSESVRLALPTPTHATPTTDATLVPSIAPIVPGPLPELNNLPSSTTLMAPGNAAGLFPSILPSAAATTPGAQPNPARTQAAQAVEVLPLGMSMMTAQVIGIGALLLAVALAVLARLLPGRRTR
jgi:hypothetical protein